MTEIEYKLQDLINFSSSQKPIEFNDVFNAQMAHRIEAAVNVRKLQLAQSLVTGIRDEQELQVTGSEEKVDGEAA